MPKSTVFLLSLERSDVKEEYDEAEEAVNQDMGNDLSDAESGLIHSKGKASETRCDLNNVLSFSHTPLIRRSSSRRSSWSSSPSGATGRNSPRLLSPEPIPSPPVRLPSARSLTL